MNNLFNKIDSIDLTSILTEDENAIQEELNLEFSGKWEEDKILSENEIEINNILREISDTLAIMNEDISTLDTDEISKLVESVLDRVVPRWNHRLYENILFKLGVEIPKRAGKSLKEEDSVEGIQREISDLKSGIEGLDKSGQTEFEYNNQTYDKTTAGSRISSLESKLKSMNKDNNENRENGFGDETVTEDDKLFEGTKADIMKKHPELQDNPNYKSYADDDWMAVDYNEDGSIKGLRLADKKEINESIASNVTVDNIDQEPKNKATIDKAIEIAGSKDTIDNDTFRELRLQLANKDYDLVDRSKDYALVRGEDVIYTWLRAEDTKDNLKESESFNLDTIEQSILGMDLDAAAKYLGELINNDPNSFEVEGSELISTVDDNDRVMCTMDAQEIAGIAKDLSHIKGKFEESVHVNVSGGNVDVSTDNTNLSVDGDNVDVHVEDGNDLAPSVEISEPTTDEIPGEELPIDSEVSAEEIIDEPADEEVLDTPVSDEELLDDSEKLDESITSLLSQVNKSREDFEQAISDIFPNFGAYNLDEENNKLTISVDGQIVTYNVDLGQEGFVLYEEGASEEDAIVVWSTEELSGSDTTNESETLKEQDPVQYYIEEIGLNPYDVDYSKDSQAEAIINQFKEAGKLESLFDYITAGLTEPFATEEDYLNYVAGTDIEDYEIYNGPLNEEGLQVDDIPAKNDQKKRIELAKLESEEGKVSYRVSYLKEDDEEIVGWDIDADTDEDAIASLDQFSNADEIADDLLTAEFVETGIDGISSLNYKNTNILLSSDEENNIITINQDGSDPIIFKGESFDEVLNQLIYWFITNTDEECPGEECTDSIDEPVADPEPLEDLPSEEEDDKDE